MYYYRLQNKLGFKKNNNNFGKPINKFDSKAQS
jgi:hypothetical protein